MMKTITIFIFFLLIFMRLKAQEFKRYWYDGKLSWSDFRESMKNNGISELKYFLGYHTIEKDYHDTTIIRIEAYCYSDKELSWVNPNYKTENYLRFNQVVFDIAELNRRNLQNELDRLESSNQVEILFREKYNHCTIQVDEFENESNHGQDLKVIQLWEKKIGEELNRTNALKIPFVSKGNIGYGLHAGLGTGLFTGSLNEHFGQSINFIFGFDLSIKKSVIYLDATLAGDKVKRDYLTDKSWFAGQTANIAIINLSYGYVLIDNAKIKLAPFAGLGITELTGKNQINGKDELKLTDYNFIFGVNADYKFWKRMTFIPDPFFGIKEYFETSVRARLYITRAKYFNDLSGFSVNLIIGISGYGNPFKLN